MIGKGYLEKMPMLQCDMTQQVSCNFTRANGANLKNNKNNTCIMKSIHEQPKQKYVMLCIFEAYTIYRLS